MAGVGAALLFSLGELLPTAAPELLQQLRPKQSPSASERQEDAAPLEAELDEELEPFVAPPPPPPPPRTIGLVGGRRAGGALLALVGALLLLRWGWDLSPPPLPHVSLHSRQGGALRAALRIERGGEGTEAFISELQAAANVSVEGSPSGRAVGAGQVLMRSTCFRWAWQPRQHVSAFGRCCVSSSTASTSGCSSTTRRAPSPPRGPSEATAAPTPPTTR